jgi:cysteine desulfuration protein SufE
MKNEPTIYIPNNQNDLIQHLSGLGTWDEKFTYIIDIGNSMEPLEDQFRNDRTLIKECQSLAWIHGEYLQGKIIFKGSSNSIIIRGLIGLILNISNNMSPAELIEMDYSFLKESSLDKQFSNRASGLTGIISKIKSYARDFEKMDDKKTS